MNVPDGTVRYMRESLSGLLTERATLYRFEVRRTKGQTTKERRATAESVPCMVTPAASMQGGGSRRVRWDERVLAVSTHLIGFEAGTDVDTGDEVQIEDAAYKVVAVSTGARGRGDTIRARVLCLAKVLV